MFLLDYSLLSVRGVLKCRRLRLLPGRFRRREFCGPMRWTWASPIHWRRTQRVVVEEQAAKQNSQSNWEARAANDARHRHDHEAISTEAVPMEKLGSTTNPGTKEIKTGWFSRRQHKWACFFSWPGCFLAERSETAHCMQASPILISPMSTWRLQLYHGQARPGLELDVHTSTIMIDVDDRVSEIDSCANGYYMW